MNKKLLLFITVSAFVIVGVSLFQRQPLKSPSDTENYPNLQSNLGLEDCEEKEIQNLKNNEFLIAEQLSVVFYTNPSADFINMLAEKYDLEIRQVYNDPNVIFGVEKENAPIVKCQLENESEIMKVVFIESRPV